MKLSYVGVLIFLASASAIMHENVFFHKIGDFSMSRSKWLISFVIGLSTYKRFLDKLTKDIETASHLTDRIINNRRVIATKQPMFTYKNIFGGFRAEIEVIRDMHNDIKSSFNDYKLLREPDNTDKTRHKHRIFGFVGDLMSSLFGVMIEGDVSSIQRNIKRLTANQQEISHVVAESLSVLNASRIEIKENRQKVNDIIVTVSNIEDEMINISNQLEAEIRDVRVLLALLAKVNLVIEEIKNALSRSMYFYTHFQLQLQAVTMQKLSPSTIPASILRAMLLQIQEKLPKTIGLPLDPYKFLFSYYRYLNCIPLFIDNHIIISVNIPLVEYSQQFDIFRAYSLPVPLLGRAKIENNEKNLLEYYQLESNYLAINADRSQYIMLDKAQVSQCSQSGLHICNIKSPIRNSNIGHSCLLSNFNQDKAKVKRYCDIWIHQTPLPTAFYLSNDVYLVIVNNPLVFHLPCKDSNKNNRTMIRPPFGFLTLDKSCQATSSYFTLMGYYVNQSEKIVNNPASIILKEYNISDIRVWDDINLAVPFKNVSVKSVTIPPKLANMEDFPLENLMYDLNNRRGLEPMKVEHFPLWAYVIIFLIVVIILSVLAFCIQSYKLQILSKLHCLAINNKPKIGKDFVMTPVALRTTVDDDDADEELSNPLTSSVEGANIIKKKFVALDIMPNSRK